MIEPYYKDNDVTLYCGKAEEVLPEIVEKCNLMLTDPPYGIDYLPNWKKWSGKKMNWDKIKNDDKKFNPEFLIGDYKTVIFGAEHFIDLLPDGGWIIWDKRVDEKNDRMFGKSFEMAWINIQEYKKIYRIKSGGVINPDSLVGNNEPRMHPTQKPVKLMMQIILEFTLDGEMIFDPFAGSGTTLIAAKLLKRKAIGIEISEKYCELIVNRLNKPMPLFEQYKESELFDTKEKESI